MARRKGNRKVRRDSKRDSSGLKRIAKVGAVVTGVTLGGAAFLRSDLGKKFLESGVSEAVIKTSKGIKKDFLNKPKNLRTLKAAYDKNIGKNGEVFKKELAKQKGKMKENLATSKLTKDLFNISQTKETIKRKARDIEIQKDKRRFKDMFTAFVQDDAQRDALNDIVDALYTKTTEENLDNKTLIAHYKKTLKKNNFAEDDINDLLKNMHEWKEARAGKLGKQYIDDKYGKLAEDVAQRQMNDFANERAGFIEKIFNRFTGTRAATLKDVKDGLIDINDIDFGSNFLRYFNNDQAPVEKIDMNKMVANLMSMGDKYDNVVLDKAIRVGTRKGGEQFIADYSETFDLMQGMFDWAKDTLPGKILLKPWDTGTKHNFGMLLPDKLDNMANLFGSDDNMMKDAMVYLNGTLFGIKEDAKGVVSLDESVRAQVKEVTGWRKQVLHELMGSKQNPAEAYTNPLAQMFDINQTGSFNIKETWKRLTGKSTDEKWEKNQLQLMKEYVAASGYHDGSIDTKRMLYDSAYMTSIMMNRNITGVSDELLDNMIQNTVAISDQQSDMLKLLLDGSEDSMHKFINSLSENMGDLQNEKLINMIASIQNNAASAAENSHISMKSTGPLNPIGMLFGSSIDEIWERDAVGQFRVEYVKEILMNKTSQDRTYMDYIDLIAKNDRQKDTLKNIGMLGLFEQHMQVGDIIADSLEAKFEVGGAESHFIQRLQGDYRLMESFNQIMDNSIKGISGLSSEYFGNINETDFYDEFNDIALIKQSSLHPLNLIKSINESIQNREFAPLGKTLLDGLKEVTTAGRWDTEHISNLTLGAQYAMSRLNHDLESVGLNLSTDSMSSPLATYLNIGLKRILPTAVGIGAFSYLNDESRRFLGSSIVEAGARGLSYLDIGARKFAYAVPLPKVGKVGQKLDNWAETSVIHEYMFGSNSFDTAEEREEWYEKGYSPVRKGRFWSFGSSSEFRGGAISYWQPNYLRRAESNYHDIAIYGSSEEKWAHSWIPTPTHPFSTVRALMDPYWLEKKHLKEGDMPYPVTAKMFSEGTPWGAILNPTVGELLKPVRMLPEARMRLGRTGRDSQAVIQRINERIARKEQDVHNDDLIVVSGTDIRNAEYIPFVNPEPGELNIQVRNGQAQMAGYDFMSRVQGIQNYTPPTGEDYVQVGRGGKRSMIYGGTNATFAYGAYNTAIQTIDGMTNYNASDRTERVSMQIISSINNAIKSKGRASGRNAGMVNDSSNSTYVYRNLVNEYNNYLDSWYGERNDPAMISRSVQGDYMKDLMHSSSQISGIYGYLGGMFNNSDHAYSFRYENAGQMTSFSRGFWDASIGGLGGGPMEIARRFFPSEDRSRINVNPLLNNMPDWIPESYHTGNPYAQIPKGEMRLPGKGYEAINDLHPDEFGDYGAFDRYKILADIAPNSTEYKTWRNIAKATVKDPELLEEMDAIAERTAKMSGNHEFFEYKYMRNNTAYAKGIVLGINNGVVTLADHSQLSLAGVQATGQTDEALSEMLRPGMEITYRYEKNKVYDKNDMSKNQSIAAVITAPKSKESINKLLIESGAAKKDVEDRSTIAQLGRISAGQEVQGALEEFIAHAKIPIIHNKFLRVDSAYESYMKETYYGSSFKTWDHPIKAFITPMFNEQSSKSLASEAISLGVAYFHFTKGALSDSPVVKWASNIALATTNPTAFMGGNLNFILHMSNGGKGKGQELTNWQKGAKIGTIIGTAKYVWDNADNPFKAAGMMATAGAYMANTDFGWEVAENILGKMTTKKGALIGVGIGLGISAIKNSRADKKMFEKWAPKETRKKWELDEYFDRLTYVKYAGLFERAADRARRYEKVDIEGIFEEIDKNKAKINKLNVKAAKLINKTKSNNDRYAKKLRQIEEKKMMLEEQTQMMFSGGEYTKSAIAYKKKMESTMYGLDPNATKDELLASVPDQYKDFFTAFMDVTDKKEQKKILKSVSPMMRRPLQAAWGMELEKVQSNKKYFRTHKLPGTFWRGWKPNVNIKHVKMKTIENEGMLLSDFGYYDSEKAKVTFDDAPEIENYDQGMGRFSDVRIKSIMHGNGIMLNNVSISKTRAPGIWVLGDVKERVEDRAKVTGYGIVKTVSTLGSIF